MPDPAALRVLVVDDDPMMVALVGKLLEAAGYRRIAVARTAADCLALAEEADLILLDHQLPDGMGVDLLPRLVGRVDPPSVVMVTGEGSETLAAAALRAGAEDYLVKDQQLRAMLPQIVERVRRTRALREAQIAVERDLAHAERLAAIGELTVSLHHEINNPLMTATSEIELLLAGGGLSPVQRSSLEIARDALLRIRDLVKRIGNLRSASSAEYVAGLRMINLGGAAAAAIPHRGRALLWIPDQDTGRLAAMILRHAGFTIERVSSALELTATAGRVDVRLVVLAVPGGTDPVGALGGFEPEPRRPYAVVALTHGDPEGARRAGVDRVVSLPFDPARIADEFLEAVAARE